jgi:hypothetical protein
LTSGPAIQGAYYERRIRRFPIPATGKKKLGEGEIIQITFIGDVLRSNSATGEYCRSKSEAEPFAKKVRLLNGSADKIVLILPAVLIASY